MIRQIIRGCGNLPHVGEHPGTWFVLLFAILGSAAGFGDGSWRGALGGAAIMTAFVLPFYLIGAWSRAEESDRLVNEERFKRHELAKQAVKNKRDADFWDIAQAFEQPEEPGRVEYKFLGVTGLEDS